ncbi:MAG: flavodoxin-dependent (E)-4-hydroxy-3-methylbut-2-enyl-diphosphate synthase [Phycisphaerae bacterium]|nr:flavodoxin-dependent (E)-4-hydroxy-3-methylbut-2-enyl-diphosphate synthase [Phycisphaerae bacterium]
MKPRRPTRPIFVGDSRVGIVQIGGGLPRKGSSSRPHPGGTDLQSVTSPAPVSVQTMTAGYTHDIDKCVAEIHKLAAAGADIVRVAVPEKKDTDALKEIIPQVRVPIVADVHFHFQRAIEAVEAGVHKIRLNPGNITDRAQVIDVIQACKAKGLPIRVGVNEGSIIERRDKQKRKEELGKFFAGHKNGHLMALMVAKLEEYMDIFYEQDFYDVAISAKSMDAAFVVDVYTAISERFDEPLHLGVTHAGPKETGCIRSIAALSALLCNGIGDTIRISYANDPIYEVEDGLELLWSLGLRERKGVDLIACPTCGRIQVDLFTLVQDVRKALAAEITVPIKVAVMGCIVNGPGEAEGADVAIFAGDRRGIIYVQGEKVANVPEPEILDRLLKECREFQAKVMRGEAKLGEKKVDIIPPDPIGELGSGFDKIASGNVEKRVAVTVSRR